jgi:hypothetical protein
LQIISRVQVAGRIWVYFEKKGDIWWILADLGKFIVIWMKFGGFWRMLVDFGKPLRLLSL